MTVGPPPRLRADARRNRDKLIETATRAFAEYGPDVPMEKVAQRAGVGVGTLYRHFPDREALVLAVVQASLATTLERARQARDEEVRAFDALVRSMSGSLELRLTLRVSHLFSPAATAAIRADPTIREISRELGEIADGLVRAAQEEGTLRPDVGSGDVRYLFSLLLHGRQDTPGETSEIAFERAREIVLDGLRARPGTPLPGRPLTAADLDAE